MLSSICTILVLCFVEGVLSLDNALVLAALVLPLPKEQRKKALTYGVWGAIGFRALALIFLTKLISVQWIQIAGGLYLIYMAIAYFMSDDEDKQIAKRVPRSFWWTVATVELMDIAFSADSILASVSISQTYWVLLVGGIMGIIMMRYASVVMITLLEVFPELEVGAYGLIAFLGAKMVAETEYFAIIFRAIWKYV